MLRLLPTGGGNGMPLEWRRVCRAHGLIAGIDGQDGSLLSTRWWPAPAFFLAGSFSAIKLGGGHQGGRRGS
jgi:hypothetical protein